MATVENALHASGGGGSGLVGEGVNDRGFSRLEMLADRGLFDVQGIGNHSLSATSRTVVITQFNRFVKDRSLTSGKQFNKFGIVDRLRSQFHAEASTQQGGKAVANVHQSILRAPNREREPFVVEHGWRNPPSVFKRLEQLRKRSGKQDFR